jgi:hypothetical protein
MSDLVERLRSVDWDYLATNNLCHEAADEIARLTAEVERMKAVVDAVRGVCDHRRGKIKGTGFLIYDALDDAIRALDGESRNHSTNVTKSVTLEEKFPTCGGIGRKPVVSKSVQRRLEIQRG